MNLRITVQGAKYDVDVAVLEDDISSVSTVTPPLPPQRGNDSVGVVTSPIAGTVFDIRARDDVSTSD